MGVHIIRQDDEESPGSDGASPYLSDEARRGQSTILDRFCMRRWLGMVSKKGQPGSTTPVGRRSKLKEEMLGTTSPDFEEFKHQVEARLKEVVKERETELKEELAPDTRDREERIKELGDV
jgi:hypothetical protein